jgi:integrase/recombinase XerC
VYRLRRRRRLYVREQLTIYHREAQQEEIPHRDQYLQFMVKERGYQLSTARSNLSSLRQFALFLAAEYRQERFNPAGVTPAHIRRYLAYMKNELNNCAGTRNHKLNAIASYYTFLECYEYIDEEDNPTRLIRRARIRRRLPLYMTAEEAAAFLEAVATGANHQRDTALFRVMIQAGLRVVEMVRLRVQDVDLKERTLLVQGKGNIERLVPLTDNTCLALEAYLSVRKPTGDDVDALFLTDSVQPVQGYALNGIFKQYCRQAGVEKPGLTVRHLRHTCLTLLMQEGADLLALKKLAGHRRVSTTQVYLHVTQRQLREAMKKHPLG